MNNDPIVNIGDFVKLEKEAWNELPKLTEEELVASLSKLRVLEAFPIESEGYPNLKRLVLKGLEDHPIESIYVSLVK